MPTLEKDRLVFRFPQIEQDASFSINFQRTLRIPDTEKTYGLPPGLGSFPVRHVEDFADKLDEISKARGGVMLPMWQAEAMWFRLNNSGPHSGLDFPVAIKIAAGKINAVTGEPWKAGLSRDPQDYMVSPKQPWLDGFAIEKDVIRQFVAMPLGEGYTAEEQLTGEAEWGGLQIMVMPLKAHVWTERKAAWEEERRRREEERRRWVEEQRSRGVYLDIQRSISARSMPVPSAMACMGMGAGGRMRQTIHPDPFNLDDWDVSAADRVFVTLVHAKDWKAITGEPAADLPPTAAEYSRAGLPWFDVYGADKRATCAGRLLSGLQSVAKIFRQKTGAELPASQDVKVLNAVKIEPKFDQFRSIRDFNEW